VLGKLGYYVATWNLDPNDWQHPEDGDASFRVYQNEMDNSASGSSFISLQHDIRPSTNGQLVERVVTYARSLGKSPVRVGECLGASSTNIETKISIDCNDNHTVKL
jgi:peptidoglycan/xylan/chitin deacetylase (PgdA/CDA1 family)